MLRPETQNPQRVMQGQRTRSVQSNTKNLHYRTLQGQGTINIDGEPTSIEMGEVVLVPAMFKSFTIETSEQLILLESYIEG